MPRRELNMLKTSQEEIRRRRRRSKPREKEILVTSTLTISFLFKFLTIIKLNIKSKKINTPSFIDFTSIMDSSILLLLLFLDYIMDLPPYQGKTH